MSGIILTPPRKWLTPKVYQLESQLVADILMEFGAQPWIRIWRNNVGKAYGAGVVMAAIKSGSVESLQHQRPIKFGTPGETDTLGFIRLGSQRGRIVGIECKIGNNKLNPDQVAWRSMFENGGGLYILAYQVLDCYLGFKAAGVLE